jgi:uncharacterized membrane protein
MSATPGDLSGTSERSRDLERFLTFVDAVVAIAITLLVLPLVDLSSELSDGTTARELLHDHKGQIGAFVLGFLVIARLWLIQHHAFRPIVAMNDRIAHVMVFWMLSIVVLPFGTSLLASTGSQPTTKLIYFGAIGVSTIMIALVKEVVARNPAFAEPGTDVDPIGTWANVVLLGLGLALSLLVPALSYWPLVLLLTQTTVTKLLRRWRDGRRPA